MNQRNHALVGAYAADALDDVERDEFEAHLQVCPECAAEVASLQEATATIAEATATDPPAGLRDRLMGQISAVRPLPPLVGTDSDPTDRTAPGVDELAARRRRRRVTGVLAAAAAVVAIVGVGAATPWVDGESDLSPSQRVLQADDALRSSLDLGAGATATVVHSEGIGQSVIVTDDMPAPPAGEVYQLWYDQGGDFVNAGLMPAAAGDQTVRLQGDSREASGVGITVEPVGGSSSPTSDPIAMFDFGPGA